MATKKVFLRQAALQKFLDDCETEPLWDDSALDYFNLLHTHCKNDDELLAECMAKTFAPRRHDIEQHKIMTSAVLKYYPGFSDYQEIKKEFKRIKPNIQLCQFEKMIVKRMDSTLNQKPHDKNCKCKQIISHASMCIFGNQFVNPHKVCLVDADVKEFICEQSNGEWMGNLVIFASKGKEHIELTRSNRSALTIVVDEAAVATQNCSSIYMDKVKVVDGLSFLHSIFAAFYIHYIFHLDYDPMAKNVFKIFEEVLHSQAERISLYGKRKRGAI